MSTAPADYIQAFMQRPAPDMGAAALVIIDMQHATGSRTGALGRRVLATPEGRAAYSYRFDRIEGFVVPNTRRLLAGFRAAAAPVVHVTVGAARPDASDAPPHMRQFFAGLGNHLASPDHKIIPELTPAEGEHVLRKTTIGAFASTGIDSLLRALGVSQIYMTGVSTNMCVETTAREAADRGYGVTLVEDACGATHADLHAVTMRNFGRLFGHVLSCDAALAELGLGDA